MTRTSLTSILAALALVACSKSQPEVAPTPAAEGGAMPAAPAAVTPASAANLPGATVGKVVTEKARVIAVDTMTRMVTLVDEDGDTATVSVGPEVKRLGEVRVGDNVVAQYVEALALEVRKSGPGAARMVVQDTLVRLPGSKPGAMSVQRITATVEVIAIDTAEQEITVRTARGVTIPMQIKDPASLAGISVGDRVDVTYVEAFGLSVETP